MSTLEITRTANRVHAGSDEAAVKKNISTMALAVLYGTGIIIGLWSLAAVLGALFSVGGPLGLINGYFQAVTGL